MNKILLVAILLPLAACQREEIASRNDKASAAENPATGTCNACGMVMREQPAPRGR